jgi:hypothetical protein
MRMVTLALFVALFAPLACQSASSPSEPDASDGTLPTEDGAVCACASPDCLPNCSHLPACKLECTNGVKIDWLDPCGHTQYTQSCPNGCTDAAPPACE